MQNFSDEGPDNVRSQDTGLSKMQNLVRSIRMITRRSNVFGKRQPALRATKITLISEMDGWAANVHQTATVRIVEGAWAVMRQGRREFNW